MSDGSTIEWTDATWNPVRGCVKVSPGCAHCYTETFAERFRGVPGHPYEQGFDLRLVPEKLAEPLSWKKPRRVFVNSMSDLFQDGVPDEYILRVFEVMEQCPQHTFQVLTKRPERMLEFFAGSSGAGLEAPPLPNVWLGVSVENQHFADERIPLLLQTPAVARFISAEPLLGPVLLDNGDTSWLSCTLQTQAREGSECCMSFMERQKHFRGLDWVIVGGESGPGARLFRVEWARSIIAQCRAANVPVFMKQIGANSISALGLGQIRQSKGGDPSEWPADLRVREFPSQ